jgi:hypothetical protein
MGSFEGWSGLVRAALVWCGAGDPVAGQRRIRAEADVGVDDTHALLATWDRDLQGLKLTVREVVDRVGPFPELHELLKGLETDPRLADRLQSRRLGYHLRKLKNRPVGGRVLRQSYDEVAKVMLWWVEAGADGQASGDPAITGASPDRSPVDVSSSFLREIEEITGDPAIKPSTREVSGRTPYTSSPPDVSCAPPDASGVGNDHRITGNEAQSHGAYRVGDPPVIDRRSPESPAPHYPRPLDTVFDPDAGDALEPES